MKNISDDLFWVISLKSSNRRKDLLSKQWSIISMISCWELTKKSYAVVWAVGTFRGIKVRTLLTSSLETDPLLSLSYLISALHLKNELHSFLQCPGVYNFSETDEIFNVR